MHCSDIKRQVMEYGKDYVNDTKAFSVAAVLVFSGTDLTGPHCFYFLHSRFSSSLLKPPTTLSQFLSSVKPLQ